MALNTKVTLVTGGNGFIGRHLVRLLRDREERLRVLDILDSPDCHLEGVEYLRGSVEDKAFVKTSMQDVSKVYHLAANPKLWHSDKGTFERTNLFGTKNVLKAAEAAGVERLVYTSTESILKSYRRDQRGLIDERIHLELCDMPGSYCRSKFLAEQAALQASKNGLDVVIVNPTLPVGPGDYLLTPPTKMMLDFVNQKLPQAYLECQLNMIDVRDVAFGHIQAMDKGGKGERYILGHQNLSLSRLLKILESFTGLTMPTTRIPYPVAWCAAVFSELIADYITKRPPMAPLTGVRLARTPMVFDNTKAVSELGLPLRPIEDSLRDMLIWFQDVGLFKGKKVFSLEKDKFQSVDSISVK